MAPENVVVLQGLDPDGDRIRRVLAGARGWPFARANVYLDSSAHRAAGSGEDEDCTGSSASQTVFEIERMASTTDAGGARCTAPTGSLERHDEPASVTCLPSEDSGSRRTHHQAVPRRRPHSPGQVSPSVMTPPSDPPELDDEDRDRDDRRDGSRMTASRPRAAPPRVAHAVDEVLRAAKRHSPRRRRSRPTLPADQRRARPSRLAIAGATPGGLAEEDAQAAEQAPDVGRVARVHQQDDADEPATTDWTKGPGTSGQPRTGDAGTP